MQLYLFICALLIITIILAVFGLFLCQKNTLKLFCLSIAYSSFLFFAIFLSFKNSDRLNVILPTMVSILIVFAINLFIGFRLAKNVQEPKLGKN